MVSELKNSMVALVRVSNPLFLVPMIVTNSQRLTRLWGYSPITKLLESELWLPAVAPLSNVTDPMDHRSEGIVAVKESVFTWVMVNENVSGVRVTQVRDPWTATCHVPANVGLGPLEDEHPMSSPASIVEKSGDRRI